MGNVGLHVTDLKKKKETYALKFEPLIFLTTRSFVCSVFAVKNKCVSPPWEPRGSMKVLFQQR